MTRVSPEILRAAQLCAKLSPERVVRMSGGPRVPLGALVWLGSRYHIVVERLPDFVGLLDRAPIWLLYPDLWTASDAGH